MSAIRRAIVERRGEHPHQAEIEKKRALQFQLNYGSSSAGSTQPTGTTSGVDQCQAYMVDCTAQQDCEIWGMSCDLVENGTPQVASTGEDSSGTPRP